MLTADGCRQRRERFLQTLRPVNDLLLGDPLHVRYFAGVYVDPVSYSADFYPLLLLRTDGSTVLYHDNRLKGAMSEPHVDKVESVNWYDGKSAGTGVRRSVLLDVVKQNGGRVHDSLGDEMAADILATVGEMRRSKDTDEVELLRKCMRCGDAGQAWAKANVKAGMTELQVYSGVAAACLEEAGRPAVVYGDFAVSPGMSRKGGPPTDQVLSDGDMLILDFSVVLSGYRSDFTNTLVVGGKPNAEQTKLYDLCRQAMSAGEGALKAGAACVEVYRSVRKVFEQAGVADKFPHHAGHGLGMSHPEAPFLVERADKTLVAGDVVTLEPGLYVDGVGGIRIEHNYLITDAGFDRLSNHEITLS